MTSSLFGIFLTCGVLLAGIVIRNPPPDAIEENGIIKRNCLTTKIPLLGYEFTISKNIRDPKKNPHRKFGGDFFAFKCS